MNSLLLLHIGLYIIMSKPPSLSIVHQTPAQSPPPSPKGSPKDPDDARKLNPLSDANKKQYEVPTQLIKRPTFNSSGLAATVAVNSYPILQFPSKKVYQYDVSNRSTLTISHVDRGFLHLISDPNIVF